MCKRSLGVDIPAPSRVRRVGVDDDEPVLVGELAVGCAAEVCLGGTSAVMGSDENWGVGRGGNLVGNVNKHSDIGRVCAKVVDLLK